MPDETQPTSDGGQPRPHVETFHQLHDGTPILLACFCERGEDHVTVPAGAGLVPQPHWRAPRRPVRTSP
ncbi:MULTISPECIES: hypothetical protein [unclassified Curtobacterium]|uniref:hypothetical protein n=1 Tax=unclassified Curtobacterium TaxID=257496 RepID=UPI000DA851A0|nr:MULTISPECIES: hypothetical protein [unclassified Curtobacterium]PZE78323.1 hypothetical protein DEI82_00655 [Curtobacterium sp. MCBD17_019]WIE55160.1 hypothetical protein DEI88_002825 [Curtobacterium sp. MCBD17_003]